MLREARSRLNYGWVIFVLSLGNLTVEGGTKNSEAVFFNVLREAFGRSATYTSLVFSLAGLIGAVAAPWLGVLLDRWGARVLFPLAGVLILIGWLASSFASDLWQLLIFYSVFAGIGQTAISSFSMTATLAPWFPQTRGRMLGLADSGNPIGQAIFAPLAAILTENFGWRTAYRCFAGVFFVLITFPNGLLQRRAPPVLTTAEGRVEEERSPREPDAADLATSDDQSLAERSPARSLGGVVRQPAMWLLVLTRITGSVGTQLVRVHLVSFFVLAGYSTLTAASTMGAVGAVSVFARPLVGVASDKWGRELVFTIGMLMTVVAVLLIVWLGDGSYWPLVMFVTLAGVSDGISGLIIGAKAADLFPQESLGTVMGFVEMGRGAAIFLGPVLGGVMFDLQGNYVQAFILSAGMSFVSICAAWGAHFVGNASRGRREQLAQI